MLISMQKKLISYVNQLALGLTLLSLHVVIVWGFATPMQKVLLMCHAGFFLVWQPILQAKKELSSGSVLMFVLVISAIIVLINWWIIAFWIAILFGLLGGRILSTKGKSARLQFIFGASYLLSVLLFWVVPQLLHTPIDSEVADIAIRYVLPALPLLTMLGTQDEGEKSLPPMLDFFYTLAFILFAVILVLGSFAIKATSGANYAEVLVQVVFGLAVALVIVSWVWNPHLGFAGLGQLVSRYLLSLGLPFEEWMRNVATLAETESSPQHFIEATMQEIAKLDWVSGLTWKTTEASGEIGLRNAFKTELKAEGLNLNLYTKTSLTPALALHVKLLSQILGEFYAAKRREETLKQNTYMHAVYETGARLTHDIKNIVQSMNTLCSAAEHTAEADNDKLLALIRRQLPQLNQRLALTLDKLKAPNADINQAKPLNEWWQELKQRHLQTQVSFVADDVSDQLIDEDVLTSVVDNLLQNALEKAKHERDIQIQVEINRGQGVCIEVSDTGSAMPKQLAEQLFKKRVKSENGLGIGLYQAGKQAEHAGYDLAVVENKEGEVRFRLAKAS